MKIAVTGASGFLGSWLCKILDVPKDMQFDLPDGDIRKNDVLKWIVSADTIIHLAAISGVGDCERNSEKANEINYEATIELAEAARKSRVKKIVFASSSSVYGEANDYHINEQHETIPRGVYGATKLKAERYLSKLTSDSFRIIILRKSNLYGYGIKWKGKTVLDQFIEKYLSKTNITIAGNGTQKRDFVHLYDAARLYKQIALNEKARSGIYNVGGQETISIRALADLVNEIGESILGYRVGVEYIDADSGAGWHDFKYDWSKAQMEFQYQPHFTLDDYIKERIGKWLRETNSH